MSQQQLERKLAQFIAEVREGRRQGSVLSLDRVDSAPMEDDALWSQLCLELENAGIPITTLREQKDWVISWFKKALLSGALQKETAPDEPRSPFDDKYRIPTPPVSDARRGGAKEVHGVLSDAGDDGGKEVYGVASPLSDSSRRLPRPVGTNFTRSATAPPPRPPKPKAKRWLHRRSNSSKLETAAYAGDLETLRLQLRSGTCTNPAYAEKALRAAARCGHAEVLELLLGWGTDVNSPDSKGQTALHNAVESSQSLAARLLLVNHANPEAKAKGNFNRAPLHYAATGSDLATLRVLLDFGAKMEAREYWGRTALHLAAEGGHEEAVRALVDHGADKEARDDLNRTPLYLAAEKGAEAIVRLLLDLGADRLAKSSSGKTALDRAKSHGQKGIVQLLQQERRLGTRTW